MRQKRDQTQKASSLFQRGLLFLFWDVVSCQGHRMARPSVVGQSQGLQWGQVAPQEPQAEAVSGEATQGAQEGGGRSAGAVVPR